MPEPMQTAEEWHKEHFRKDGYGITHEPSVEDVETLIRTARRQALVDAAKAICVYCNNGRHATLEGRDRWHSGRSCKANELHDLIAKHDAEAKPSEQERTDHER